MLQGKHLAGAGEVGLHLVGNEHNASFPKGIHVGIFARPCHGCQTGLSIRIQVVLVSVYLSKACNDLSRPTPLCL